MKKSHYRVDPEGKDAWIRLHLEIPDYISTSNYLLANDFTNRTVTGKIKNAKLAVAWLETKITLETEHFFTELKSIIIDYEQAYEADKLTDVHEVKMEKAQLLFKTIVGIPAERDRPFRSNVTADSGPS